MPVSYTCWLGCAAGLATESTWRISAGGDALLIPNRIVRKLDRTGDIPSGMVRVAGAETAAGPLGDFFIDRHEVTNRQFREFVDGGGYRDPEYWQHPFVEGGASLT